MPHAAAPTAPRFEHRTDGTLVLGIGTGTPRISWYVPEAEPGFRQSAYELEISRAAGEPQIVRVESADQVLVPWPGVPLAARESARVRVRVGDGGDWTQWSPPSVVEAGLLSPADWSARFVTPRSLGGLDAPAPIVRSIVDLPADVASARLYITAHGLYVAELNGRRVGDQQLTPGWTSYHHRLRYQTYDVTDLLRPGRNALEVLLGNGWYRGRLGVHGKRAHYGDRLALLAQLEVTDADGGRYVLATDGSWTARESAVLADSLYDGQRTDLRRAASDDEPGGDPVQVLDADLRRLVAPDGPPVRITEVLPAVTLCRSVSGKLLLDFGQNLVGWVRLRVRGHASGHEVVVRHAEVLENGELGVRTLGSAKATDAYVLAGPDETVLEPALTFHGFRYAEVSGLPELRREDVRAVVVGSDLRRTGWFSSSHELLDRFHANVVWSMRGNFLDVPTDCPQRNERLGWTGDIQVFAPTASFLYDSAGFLSSWLADLAADQQDDGCVPWVVPDIIRQPGPAAAAWGDAATLVPWAVYQHTGDLGLLARQLPSMRAWVDRMVDLAGEDHLWTGGFHFGDWLDPTAPPDDPFQARTHPDVLATAYLARSAEVVAHTAELVGEDDAKRYAEIASQVRDAFATEFVTPGGRVLGDAPTAYALALRWPLLPGDEQRARAGRRLADLVRTAGFRIGTGFVGTPLIADALTSAGEVAVAYRLLLQTGCPSWLYPVTMGATTIWERWDSMLPDGRINPSAMTSFNHYALGAVADWLHRRVAGLAPAEPGYRTIEVRPTPGPGLEWASARHLTPYGEVKVRWSRSDGRFTLRLRVPVGASATVHLPGAAEPLTVGHGPHEWETDDPWSEVPDLPQQATIRDVMDHEPSWRAVVAAVVGAGAADEAEAAALLTPFLDAPAAGLLDALTADGFGSGSELLSERVSRVLTNQPAEYI